MLLLLLAACGYPSYYPSSSYWGVFDTAGGDTDTGPAEIPCGATWAFDPVELQARSYADHERVLFERASDCTERALGPLRPGEPFVYTTNPGGVFVARENDGTLAAWVQVPYGSATFPWDIP